MDENKLVKRIQNGDEGGLEELVALFYPSIFRYCQWHTRSREEAEDATQQTFVNFFASFHRYTHRGVLKAYLYSIAKNVCINMAKSPQHGILEEDLPIQENGFEASEAAYDFYRLIHTLPEDGQELLLLRYVQDLTIREISAVTGIPLRTVQSRLRALQKQLQKQLPKESI